MGDDKDQPAVDTIYRNSGMQADMCNLALNLLAGKEKYHFKPGDKLDGFFVIYSQELIEFSKKFQELSKGIIMT